MSRSGDWTSFKSNPYRDVKHKVKKNIGVLLSKSHPTVDGWRELAEQLGFNNMAIESIRQRSSQPGEESAAYILLNEWATRNGSTVQVLEEQLKIMERDDVLEELYKSVEVSLALVCAYQEDGRPNIDLTVYNVDEGITIIDALRNNLEDNRLNLDDIEIEDSSSHISWESPVRDLKGCHLILKKKLIRMGVEEVGPCAPESSHIRHVRTMENQYVNLSLGEIKNAKFYNDDEITELTSGYLKADGYYFIRKEFTERGVRYILSITYMGKLNNFKLHYRDCCWYIYKEGPRFGNIEDLVAHYRAHQLTSDENLSLDPGPNIPPLPPRDYFKLKQQIPIIDYLGRAVHEK